MADIYDQLGMDLPTAFRKEQARRQMADVPEMTLDEINAEIAAARAGRKR